jgi:hypothetical protein
MSPWAVVSMAGRWVTVFNVPGSEGDLPCTGVDGWLVPPGALAPDAALDLDRALLYHGLIGLSHGRAREQQPL